MRLRGWTGGICDGGFLGVREVRRVRRSCGRVRALVVQVRRLVRRVRHLSCTVRHSSADVRHFGTLYSPVIAIAIAIPIKKPQSTQQRFAVQSLCRHLLRWCRFLLLEIDSRYVILVSGGRLRIIVAFPFVR